MYPVPGFRRRDGDERLRASAIPRHGGPRRAGRGCSGGASLGDSASASHTAHPRFHTKLDKGGAKNMYPLKFNQPCRFHGQRDELITSMGKRKRSPCQQDNHNDSLASKIMRTRIPDLPEVVDAPMLPTKFLCLKHLTVRLSSGTTLTRAFDYFSLVSFLDASPSLETSILNVSQKRMIHESISAHPQLRHTPEHRHGHLRNVKIRGFSSAKSLFELTCYILENAVSLGFLTLDTFYGDRCDQTISSSLPIPIPIFKLHSANSAVYSAEQWKTVLMGKLCLNCWSRPQGKCTRCFPVPDDVFMDASKAISAIKTYIEKKVPSTDCSGALQPVPC